MFLKHSLAFIEFFFVLGLDFIDVHRSTNAASLHEASESLDIADSFVVGFSPLFVPVEESHGLVLDLVLGLWHTLVELHHTVHANKSSTLTQRNEE